MVSMCRGGYSFVLLEKAGILEGHAMYCSMLEWHDLTILYKEKINANYILQFLGVISGKFDGVCNAMNEQCWLNWQRLSQKHGSLLSKRNFKTKGFRALIAMVPMLRFAKMTLPASKIA